MGSCMSVPVGDTIIPAKKPPDLIQADRPLVFDSPKKASEPDAKVPAKASERVWASLLHQRIRFTEQVDYALGKGTLEAVAADMR